MIEKGLGLTRFSAAHVRVAELGCRDWGQILNAINFFQGSFCLFVS